MKPCRKGLASGYPTYIATRITEDRLGRVVVEDGFFIRDRNHGANLRCCNGIVGVPDGI